MIGKHIYEELKEEAKLNFEFFEFYLYLLTIYKHSAIAMLCYVTLC